MIEKYLPIGTVVMLKGGKKRAMICGFSVVDNKDRNRIYDYSGCLYPEGMISSDYTLLFNHDQIEMIYHIGFSDDEDKKFRNKLVEVVKNTSSINNINNE